MTAHMIDGELVGGGVVHLNGRRYDVIQFGQSLNIACIVQRWSVGRGPRKVYRPLERHGRTYTAVATAYWKQQKKEV
jgi:hypothetical protein